MSKTQDTRTKDAELYWSGFTKAAKWSAIFVSLITAFVIFILTA